MLLRRWVGRSAAFTALPRRGFAIRDRYESLVKAPEAPVERKENVTAKAVKRPAKIKAEQKPIALRKAVLPPPEETGLYNDAATDDVVSTVENPRLLTVALVGLANAGKSTLLNALVGTMIAAVSNKPHTTRGRILGAFTKEETQVVFYDTPGIVPVAESSKRPRDLVLEPWVAADEADVTMLVIDASQPDDWRLPDLVKRLNKNATKTPLLVLNKVDILEKPDDLNKVLNRLVELELPVRDPYLVSALRGTHLGDLREVLIKKAKPGQWILNPDQTTDRSLLWRVHEVIRQCLFENLHKEIPYAIKQVTSGIRDTPTLLQVQQELHVPKFSHAKMAVGKRGAVAQRIAEGAVAVLEKALGKKVEVSLHFKHSPAMPTRQNEEEQ